ncbi:MAG: vitamin K epoxide reductase family protein [Gaiellales bacterium]
MSLRLWQALLSTLGLGVSGYLTWAHYGDRPIACSTGGCETVQQSAYAMIAGIPVPLLGLLAYAALLVLSVRSEGGWAAQASVTLALAGAAFSIYLLDAQLFAIGAVCQWCVVSDVVMIVLAAVCAVRAARRVTA